MTEWDLRNLHVDDARLEVLREAYTHLALDPYRARTDRATSDAENASLFAELQRHREHVCRECEGRTYVPNPAAHYTEDYADGRRTGQYSTNDPEEIDCPRCNGVGYEAPTRKAAPPAPSVDMKDEDTF